MEKVDRYESNPNAFMITVIFIFIWVQTFRMAAALFSDDYDIWDVL